MYNFLLLQYRLGRIGKDELEIAVGEGWITEEQKSEIVTGGNRRYRNSQI